MKLIVRTCFAVVLTAVACAMPVSTAEATTLFGTTTVEGFGDFLTGTHSEAFRYESPLAGTATGVSIYLTSTSGVKVALYAESGGKPSTPLATGQVSSNTANTWVAVPLESSVAITKGTHYWIALAPKGSKVKFPDHGLGGETDYEGNGFANPWSTTETYGDGPLSAYVTGEISEVVKPHQGPIASYSFDEGSGGTAYDSAGDHDGKVEGAEWTSGRFGSALEFNGEDNCVSIPESVEFQFLETEEFTLEAWVRPEGENAEAVITQEDDSGPEWEEPFAYSMLVGETGEGPKGWLRKGGEEGHEGVGAGEELPKNAWSHLAFTDDGTQMHIYIDGELASTESAVPLTPAEGPVTIGCLDNYGNYFKGKVDEVRIYERALDEAEISRDRDTRVRAGPIAAYSFDEDSGEIAHDAAGNHDGKVEGAEWTNGRFGPALQFDASEGDVVTIPDSEDLDTEEFTLEAWIRPDEDNFYGPIVAHTPPEGQGYALFSGNGEEGFEGWLTGFISFHQWINAHTFSEEKAPVGAWTHVAVTNDGNRIKLYVNGELIDNRESELFPPDEAPLQIGGDEPFAEGNFFDGKIDEVRVYNRALSAGEAIDDTHTGIETPSQGPIAAYSFNEEGGGEIAMDMAGNHDATTEGATRIHGKYGTALEFDSESDCVSVPESAELQFLETEEFTLEAWVRPTRLNIEAIVTQQDNGASEEKGEEPFSYAMLVGGEEAPKGWLRKGGESGHIGVSGGEPLPLNTWSHIAFVDDGAKLRFFVNGEVVGGEDAIPLTAAKGPLTIGCNPNYGNYFKGRVDEVRIYNRALDKAEIASDRETPLPSSKQGPDAMNTSNLADLSCTSTSNCVGVGDADPSGRDLWQVRRWSSGSWTTEKLPRIDDALLSRLSGVSCDSATSCIAVGSYSDESENATRELAARWDGDKWRDLPNAEPEGATLAALAGVDCVSGGDCIAIGRYLDAEGDQQPLAMEWSHNHWRIGTVPIPSGGSKGELSGVACRATEDCLAVGSYVNAGNEIKSLAAHWNGESWSPVSVPDPSGATSSRLAGVDCTSSSWCRAVGSYFDGSGVETALVLAQHSGTWSVEEATAPEDALVSHLTDISCASSTSCTAVGSYKNEKSELPLSLALSSGSWSLQGIDVADQGAVAVQLTGVSCPEAGHCHAVGSITYGQGAPRREFAFSHAEEGWNPDEIEGPQRRWSRVAVSAVGSRLKDVACPGSLEGCLTVGSVEAGASEDEPHLLATVGFGTDPSNQITPPTPSGATDSSLAGAACASTSSCIAVGKFHDGSNHRNGLALRWNGTTWTATATAEPENTKASFLRDIACLSSSDCLAVGGRIKSGEDTPLPFALHWNGSSWSVATPSSPEGLTEGELAAVSCNSTSGCSAVGEYADSSSSDPLAVHWNGSGWSSVSVATEPESFPMGLDAISCASSGCFAIGSEISAGGSLEVYATKPSSGSPATAWEAVEVPQPEASVFSRVTGLACPGASRCLALGEAVTEEDREIFGVSWNGSNWSLQDLEFEGSEATVELSSLACTSATACISAGASTPSNRSQAENLIATLEWPESEAGVAVESEAGAPSEGKMDAVACTEFGGLTCMAVGSLSNPTLDHPYESAVTSWTQAGGDWVESGQPTGIADGEGSPETADVDCASSTACTVVGGATGAPMISQWDGAEWHKQTASLPSGAAFVALHGISCPTDDRCTAVGYDSKSGDDRPVAYQWEEGTWSDETVNGLGTGDERLTDVSCPSAESCVAVGYSNWSKIYHWSGSGWTPWLVPKPAGATTSQLLGVSCTASDECTAVGWWEDEGSPARHGLLLRWDGVYWSEEDDPEGVEAKEYDGISCYSRVGCVAIAQTYGEHLAAVVGWDGEEWKKESTTIDDASPKATLTLEDVSCASAFDCRVVGEVNGPSESNSALVLQPVIDYADGESGAPEWGEDEEGALGLQRFSGEQQDQITELIETNPVVTQKVGDEDYSIVMGPWTFTEANGSVGLAGAIAELRLAHPLSWSDFEQWPTVAFNAEWKPTSYAQSQLELKASRVAALDVNVATVTDAEGNIVGGEVVGIEPVVRGETEYLLGPEETVIEGSGEGR
jgi:hypothetical protein